MNISVNWLKDYVEIPVDEKELVKRFTMTGLTVENSYRAPLEASGVVSAKVLDIWDHPEGKDLKVGKVTDGTSTFTAVSGAKSFCLGKVIGYAKPGSKLPGGVLIGTKDVRGVLSQGMAVCQNEVLTGGAHREGEDIIVFPENTVLGKPIQEILRLDDYIIELELTVNYSHCLSVLGVAIECAAMLGVPFRLPKTLKKWDWAGPCGSISPYKKGEIPGDERFKIALPDKDLCPRYVGKRVLGVKNLYSPIEVEKRLLDCGMRPISAVVDATNYVMFETGQPIHAFDSDLLSGDTVSARRSLRGEAVKTLDGEFRQLNEGTLVIADAKGPIAIAGVMGGLKTEVNLGTKNVFLETAWFSPKAVRETSKNLKLRTEAAIRFEKKIDPTMQVAVAERAAEVLAKWAGGEIQKGVAQENFIDETSRKIELQSSTLRRYLGKPIDFDEQKKILSALCMGIESENPKEGRLTIKIPPRRVDIAQEVDLVEEIARYKGYDSFGDSPMPKAVAGGPPNKEFRIKDEIKDFLVRVGAKEVVTTSLISEEDVLKLGWKEPDPRAAVIPLLKPLLSTETSLRTSLLPGLLNVSLHNQKQKAEGMFIFETGTVFFKGGGELPLEFQQLALCSYGVLKPRTYHGDQVLTSYYGLKGAVETFLGLLGVKNPAFLPTAGAPFHPGRSAKIVADCSAIGEMGEIHPAVLKNWGLEGPLAMAWFSLDVLLAMAVSPSFCGVSRFMPLQRDLSVIVDDEVLAGDVEKTIMETAAHLQEIALFDVYKGPPIPSGMKSLALRLTYQPQEKTLTEEDLTSDRIKILEVLSKKFGAKGRE